MTKRIIPLKNANEQPDEDVVDLLRKVLAMAERGEVRSVTIAASLVGHNTFTAHVTRDLQQAIGLVGFLHHTLCAKQREVPPR